MFLYVSGSIQSRIAFSLQPNRTTVWSEPDRDHQFVFGPKTKTWQQSAVNQIKQRIKQKYQVTRIQQICMKVPLETRPKRYRFIFDDLQTHARVNNADPFTLQYTTQHNTTAANFLLSVWLDSQS